MSCDQCHKFPSNNWKNVRLEKDAFPDVTEYPKHESCLNCHKQQFFKGAKPAICSICHTAPSPRNSIRHAFPNPREVFDTTPKGRTATSDFAVSFPHDKHIEIVSRVGRGGEFTNASWTRGPGRRRAEESCSVCHQTYKLQDKSDDEYVTKPPATIGDGFWLKKGTFKSSPIGHTTCFTCHSADSGLLPAPENCAACHTLKVPDPPSDLDPKFPATMGIDDKIMLTSWRQRGSSGKFRHEWFSHAELSCSTCHNVATINTADPGTSKVSITSCAACHVTATADDGGALNFEIDARKASSSFQCVKCHIAFGRSAIPESHLKAVAEAK
ncbi:MAG: cytochrome c3 family protein [Pyrinomonadaceae bacterium]